MKALIAAALAAAVLVPHTAMAHNFDKHAAKQADLIEYGRQTGEITWREGRRLRKEQRTIASLKAEFESDGYISKKEHRTLIKLQRAARKNIAHEANDGYSRLRFLPRVGR